MKKRRGKEKPFFTHQKKGRGKRERKGERRKWGGLARCRSPSDPHL